MPPPAYDEAIKIHLINKNKYNQVTKLILFIKSIPLVKNDKNFVDNSCLMSKIAKNKLTKSHKSVYFLFIKSFVLELLSKVKNNICF